MEESEGGLCFDFEGGLDSAAPSTFAAAPLPPPSTPAASLAAPSSNNPASTPAGFDPSPPPGAHGNRRSFRQTVCRHWLRGLCMKGDACGFLHQYDKARMPICRFFRLYGECREQDCVYKHTNEDIKECNMYKFGFCPNGPDCRYRHAKMPGPPPLVEEVLQKIHHISSFSHASSNRFFQHRNSDYNQQTERPTFPQNSSNQGVASKPSTGLEAPNAEQQSQNQQPQVNQTQTMPTQANSNGVQNPPTRTSIAPLPQGNSRYFIVKSCNRENLELSVQQGVWATQRNNEAKLNEAFDMAENVILIFSINRTRHFQGCAKMTSKIGGFVGGGNWKHAHGTAHYGRNFSMKWLKLCELSFHKTRHLRNPFNENLPVKISRDCQELEPSIGEQLASLIYLEPDSELMAIWSAAESKREEEKAKGVNPEEAGENPDIVPFEDNEEDDEEEEEESEEEDESYSQNLNAAQGRGRGRGAMWPPLLPMGRGARPIPGVRGFPPVMMGAEGYGYGAIGPDGFPMPDLFGVGSRGFGPFGPMAPRFPNDFSAMSQGFSSMNGTGPGMFHGRASQPGTVFPAAGLGMMMGAGRGPGPFMGGMGMAAARVNRPIGGMPPFRPPLPAGPPPQGNSRMAKKDQRSSAQERYPPASDQSKGSEVDGPNEDEMKLAHPPRGGQEVSFVGHNNYRQAESESESEDEAPRRYRHGEGKKRRRDSDGAIASDQ